MWDMELMRKETANEQIDISCIEKSQYRSMNEAMYHQEQGSRDVMIPSLYINYYSVALNTRQD